MKKVASIDRVVVELNYLRAFLDYLPEIHRLGEHFTAVIKALPADKRASIFHAGFTWASAYELPLRDHLTLLGIAIGKGEFLACLALDADPYETLLADLRRDESAPGMPDDDAVFGLAEIVGLSISLGLSVKAITIHQRSLSALLREAREGNDASLFHAIRIDRTILGGATAAARICRAEMLNDKRFFVGLRNALKGPSAKHWPSREEVRFTFALLAELGLDNLSDKELEALFIDRLRIFADSPNAPRNLRKQYQQSRKIVHDFN